MYDERVNYDKLISDLDNIDSISELDEEQVIKLKEKMKQIETSLKDKIKPKTITISGPTHNRIKKHCTDNELNIGEWAEMVLNKEINNKPKRMEVVLLREHNNYRLELTRSESINLYFHNFDSTKKINKVNELIYLLKDQLWDEREQMKTIKLDLKSKFKEFDTSNMKDGVFREYPDNKFVMYIKNNEIIKKLKNINLGDVCSFSNKNGFDEISVDRLGCTSWHSNAFTDNKYYWNAIVFQLSSNKYNNDVKLESQINYIFGIELDKKDFYILPYYSEELNNSEKENIIFDLNSKLMFTDKDLISIKNQDYKSDLIVNNNYYGSPYFLIVNNNSFKQMVDKEFKRYSIVDKYNLKDENGKRKRIFINIKGVELSFELNDKYVTNDGDVLVMGYMDIVEILGYSKVDDSIVIACFDFDEGKCTFDKKTSIASHFKNEVKIATQSSLRYHL